VSLALTKYDLRNWKNMYLTFNFGLMAIAFRTPEGNPSIDGARGGAAPAGEAPAEGFPAFRTRFRIIFSVIGITDF